MSAIAEADPSLAKDLIRDAEAEKDKILESISRVSEKNELLQSECKKLRAKNTTANKEMAKLVHQSKSLSRAVQKKSTELQDQQDLLKTLDAGIQVRVCVRCNHACVAHRHVLIAVALSARRKVPPLLSGVYALATSFT